MKSILPIFLIFLFTNIAYSQDQLATMVLDSVYFYEGINGSDWSVLSREYNEYDSEAKLISKTYLYKNGQHGWQTEKMDYHYNILRQQDTVTFQTWEDSQNNWRNETQNIYKYNSDSRIVRMTDRTWNEDEGRWETTTTTTLEYDDENRWIKQSVNDASRRIRIFDGNGQLVSNFFETIDNGQWITLYSTTYEYNSAGQITRIFYTNSSFQHPTNRETIYTYNNENRRTSQIVSETNAWGEIPSLKDTFIYNSFNQLVEQQKAEFDNNQWNWFNSRYLYEYDEHSNLTASTVQNRYSANDIWRNSARDETVYGEYEEITDKFNYMLWDSTSMNWYSGYWTNISYYNFTLRTSEEITKSWNNNTNDYTDNYRKLVNHYSIKTIEIIPPTEDNCSFLNPYLPFSVVHCSSWDFDKRYQLKVFSIDGKMAYETEFLGCDGFRVNEALQKGWYIFVVLDDGEILQKQKILIFD